MENLIRRCLTTRLWSLSGAMLGIFLAAGGSFSAAQQPAFTVASIRPSDAAVQFERDGKVDISPDALRMRDVTVNTCIKWAYKVQNSQVSGPDWIRSQHFDILAKAETPAKEDQMRLMLQALLAERFSLSFHREQKQLKVFALTVAKGGAKVHSAPADAQRTHQNSANGMVDTATTMQELADYMSGPLQTPVVDQTGLTGRYDYTIDFGPYLPDDMRTMRGDANGILISALEGELGLKLESRKTLVDVLIIDRVEQPTPN